MDNQHLETQTEFQPPAGILSTDQAKLIGFRVSEPKGYHPTDVENFVADHVIPSVEWYSAEIIKKSIEISELKTQLENKGLAQTEQLVDETVSQLREEISQLQRELERKNNYISKQDEYIDTLKGGK